MLGGRRMIARLGLGAAALVVGLSATSPAFADGAQGRINGFSVDAGGHLLAIKENEQHGRRELPGLDRARELEDHSRATGTVVRADEAGNVLRVVVRADDDVARRVAAAHEANDIPEPVRDVLERPARQRPLQQFGEPARGSRTRRPRAEPDLANEPRPRCLLVEAVDGRLRRR